MTFCFHCNVALQFWKADDDVWAEHARWQPKCQFVKTNKGEAFINKVQRRYAMVSALQNIFFTFL